MSRMRFTRILDRKHTLSVVESTLKAVSGENPARLVEMSVETLQDIRALLAIEPVGRQEVVEAIALNFVFGATPEAAQNAADAVMKLINRAPGAVKP